MTMNESENAASFDFESFTDKNVMECDLPELEVCYKDIDCQILKDICVDEGRPGSDINVIESCNDEKPGSFPKPPNDEVHFFEAAEDSSQECANDLITNQCGSKEANDGEIIVSKGKLESSLDNSFDKVKHCDPENSAQIDETNYSAIGKSETDSSDFSEAAENSSQECGNDLGANQFDNKEVNDGGNIVSEGKLEFSLDNSFDKVSVKHCDPVNSAQIDETNNSAIGNAETDSSDFSERNNITQPPDQILNGKTDSESPGASSAEVRGETEDIKDSSPGYNSKVESRILTFNSNFPGPVVGDNVITASVGEHSGESADAVIEELYAESAVTVIKEHSAELADAVVKKNVQEQLINVEDRNSDGASATSSIRYIGSGDSTGETAHENATNHDDSSPDDPVLISNNVNVQAVEAKVPQHEGSNSAGHASVVNQLYRDEGETSFSAASLINYSGQIAFSGSLSHRSDGSTTSTKSFAFPVLQPEWNSSPVRMAKADGRHFRKQKSWTSGLLCCRF